MNVAMQRRLSAVTLAVVLVVAAVLLVRGRGSNSPSAASTGTTPHASTSVHVNATTSTTKPAPTTTTVPPPPAVDRPLSLATTITGAISPKSVDATGTGLVFAQNMMYRHTMTVYDKNGALVKTIPDSVDLARFGY